MKEVLCRKEVSQDKRRKYVSFQEKVEDKGRQVEVFKNYFYDIKEERVLKEGENLEQLISQIQNKEESNHIYIKRIIDTNTGKVVISYIIKGNIFALVKSKLYRISFKQENILESYPL